MSKRINSYQAVASFVRGFFEAYARGIMDAAVGGDDFQKKNDPKEVVSESADLLYHLLVLWADSGVAPDQVWAELNRRVGTSGIAEKKARPKS